MILNNLKNYLKHLALLGGNCYSPNVSMPCMYPIVCTDGTNLTDIMVQESTSSSNKGNNTPFMHHSLTWYNIYSNSANYVSIHLGAGTTPVTENDYCLEDVITTNLSLFSSSKSHSAIFDAENNKLTKNVRMEFSMKNTGSKDLTVNEVGLSQGIAYQSAYYKPVLLHREVLAEPVTIPSGGVRKFEFEFEFVNQLA